MCYLQQRAYGDMNEGICVTRRSEISFFFFFLTDVSKQTDNNNNFLHVFFFKAFLALDAAWENHLKSHIYNNNNEEPTGVDSAVAKQKESVVEREF